MSNTNVPIEEVERIVKMGIARGVFKEIYGENRQTGLTKKYIENMIRVATDVLNSKKTLEKLDNLADADQIGSILLTSVFLTAGEEMPEQEAREIMAVVMTILYPDFQKWRAEKYSTIG